MASFTASETWEGILLPTARITESYRGQTFLACHHQNNDMNFRSVLTAPALLRFDSP